MKRITTPYIGLRPFGERDAVLFFGREQHVRELLTKLDGKQRFIAVLGASGTGKSSLVRAGLIPALHRGSLKSAGYNWNVCIFKPGDAPLTNLAQALVEHKVWRDSEDHTDAVDSLSAALAGGPLALTELYRKKATVLRDQALLLVVDQFEEIFRYLPKNIDEAEAFVNLLLRSSSEDAPIYVVMTMRSDYLDKAASFSGLPEAVNQGIYLTPRLGLAQLKSVIVSPLALVGGDIDPVLVSRQVNSLTSEDELPILQHALQRMWNHAQVEGRSRIDEMDFEVVCAPHDGSGQTRLSNAINNHADQIFNALTERQPFVARQVFLALIERREGGNVGRPLTLKNLVGEVGEQECENVKVVLDAFRADQVGFLRPSINERLTDDSVIDISHESLFRQWRSLKEWLSEEAKDAVGLTDWQKRTAGHKEGGGWLDEYDCERASRWRERVQGRPNPSAWARRYGESPSYSEVNKYIEDSIQSVSRIKRARRRRNLVDVGAVLGAILAVLGFYSYQMLDQRNAEFYKNFYDQTIRTTPTPAEEFGKFPGEVPCPFGGKYKVRGEGEPEKVGECEVMHIEPTTDLKFHRTEGQLFYNKENGKCPHDTDGFASIRENGDRCIIQAPNNIILYHTENTVYYRPVFKLKATMSENKEQKDFYGEDYRDFPVEGLDGAEVCSNECALDERCQAFSFSRMANRCWLKDRKPSLKDNKDTVSGEKVGQHENLPEPK